MKPEADGRCIEQVPDRNTNWPRFHQCTRKAVVEGKWCKQHSPEAKAERDRKAQEMWEKERREYMLKIFAYTFLDALRQIAAGHNNPRELAQEKLDEFEKTLKPRNR